jgi:hypothetical protein
LIWDCPGLTEVERRVLDAVAAWYRQRQAKGWASPVAYGRLTEATGGAEPITIKHLISLGLVEVKPVMARSQ